MRRRWCHGLADFGGHLALLRKAGATLGPAFDVRAFHDQLLRDGGIPLTVRHARMDR
jgi:uncharacterized protein (DUF885 family)